MYRKIILLLIAISFHIPYLSAQVPVQTLGNANAPRSLNNITAVLGAFPAEVDILQSQIQEKKESVFQQIHFTEGTLNGRKIVLAQTGIGKVNAASTATLVLEHFNPQHLIFTGIAGGINPGLHPGDIVIGTRVAYHDYGTITPDSMLRRKTRNPFTMQENPEYFLSDTSLVMLADVAAKKVSLEKIKTNNGSITPQITKGTIVTGDVFVASTKTTLYLRQQMNAEATEMEGAAVGQICWQQQVPFIVIRSLSDNANNTASADVRTFYQVAAKNSAALVVEILGLLPRK